MDFLPPIEDRRSSHSVAASDGVQPVEQIQLFGGRWSRDRDLAGVEQETSRCLDLIRSDALVTALELWSVRTDSNDAEPSDYRDDTARRIGLLAGPTTGDDVDTLREAA